MKEFNDYQKTAIADTDGNISVIATAGSGKTTVLVERIKHLVRECGADPSRILAVSFSKKACENLSERLQDEDNDLLSVDVRTFHSLGLKIVNDYYHGKYKVWTAMWEKDKVLTDICLKYNISKNKTDTPTAEILAYFAEQKVNMLRPTDKLTESKVSCISQAQLKIIYSEYEKAKAVKGYIEFDDLVNRACDIFNAHTKMLDKYREMYDYIFVDEYQDISLNQNVLLHYLNGKNNLFVVGDSLQAIYAFRGGNCKYLLDFDKEWDGAKVYNLPINYRCSNNIVVTANQLSLFTPDSHSEYYKPAIADKGDYQKPVFVQFGSNYDESKYIANTIRLKITNGYNLNSIAVLTRTNAQLQTIQSVLTDNDIACELGIGLMYWDIPEVKLVLSYLRLANDTGNNEAFAYCYNKPNRWLDKKFFEEVSFEANRGSLFDTMKNITRRNWHFKRGIDELSNTINTLRERKFQNVKEMITYLRSYLNIDAFVLKNCGADKEEIAEKLANLDALGEMCSQYVTINDFLEYVTENIKKTKKNLSTQDTVKLMTIHKSKGLEFPVVFVAGCSDGLLPHKRNENRDDEKRLFYVAITRAEKELYLTHADTYFGKEYSVSPFIRYIEDTIDTIKEEVTA